MLKFFGSSFFSMVIVATVLTPELTTAFAIVVAAVFVGLVNLYGARTARLVAMREIEKALGPVHSKVDKIEAHVNSEKTRDQGVIASQVVQLETKDKIIADLKDTAALLARAKAVADTMDAVARAAIAGATTPPSALPVQAAPDTLERIDVNTERTANNTARTDSAIQDLKKEEKA